MKKYQLEDKKEDVSGMTVTIPCLTELLQEVASLKTELQALKACLPVKRTVTISDIALIEGVSRTSLYGKEKYLLPRCGVSAYPTGVARWDMDEYLEYRKIPPDERRRMFAETVRREQKMRRRR